MKNLILLLTSLFFTGFAFGQDCSDLFVSEIVFGKQGSSLSGDATFFNHSVEIFNPTNLPINLNGYEIALVPEKGEKTLVTLTGIVPARDVFVISNASANPEIATLSNVLEETLFFEGSVAIELTKQGEIIDKIGRKGVDATSTTIDLEQLLNDPDYLNSFDINLRSIENLLIRRRRLVKQGNPDFYNQHLITEWAIYPDFITTDLGYHVNACLVPVLSWDGFNVFNQEDERFESEIFDPVFGTIVLSEPTSDDIIIFIENVFSEYVPLDPQATQNLDFTTPIDPFIDLTIAAGVTAETYELLTTLEDLESEGDEGTGFLFDIVDDNGTGAVIEFNGDLFDIKIKEINTSTSDIGFSSKISVSPTIVSEILTIESNELDLQFESVRLIGLDSKFIADFKLNSLNKASLDISAVQSSGYHILLVRTNKGTAVKRIFKF